MKLARRLPADFRACGRRILLRAAGLKDPYAYRIASWRQGVAPRVALPQAFPGIDAIDVRLVRPLDRTEDTSLDPYELLVLCLIERFVDARKVLEIGTFDGGTTVNLAANIAEGGAVTTVDLPPDWDGRLQLDVRPELRNVTSRSSVGAQLRDTPEESRVTQVFGDSATLDWERLGGPFDLVFIDGCHAYEYVVSDTENALRHLREGGVVVWHDYGMMDDVSRAVDEHASDVGVSMIRGTRLAVAVKRPLGSAA